MKYCNLYKKQGTHFFVTGFKTSSAEDCVQAMVPGKRGGRGTLRGGGATPYTAAISSAIEP